MNTAAVHATRITTRENLDFGLDGSIPRYWFDGDPFKTRLLDGLQLSFPDGERYFISSVRVFRDQVKESRLAHHIKEFMRQEGQHGMAHTKFNEVLAGQGLPVKEMVAFHKNRLDSYTRRFSPQFNVALTAAFEHMTALMAEAFFGRKEVTAGCDPRMQALLAWHSIEEMEHKAVVFDLMTKVVKVGYLRRCAAMIYGTWETMSCLFSYSDRMLKADGFSWFERKKLFFKNLGWMYGRRGVLSSFNTKVLAYFKPGFHPTDIPEMRNYPIWVREYERSGSPMKACQAMLAHAA